MGFLQRLGAVIFGPSDSIGSHQNWLIRAIGGGKTKAGVPVSEWTATNLPVVYACVNRIANPLAQVPLGIFKKGKNGSDPVDGHPMSDRLVLRPNDFMSSRTLRKTIQRHTLLWGNGYCEIERNGRGQAVGLWPLLPDRTLPVRMGEDLVYRTSIAGQTHELPHDDVLHIMDQSQDGYIGLSPIFQARQALGIAFATEEFGAKFFANEAKSGGFLMHPGKLSAQAQANLAGPKERRSDAGANLEKQGGLDNANRVKVLEEGMKFISTTIPPEDAQFLGTRLFQIGEIARLYDVPLILLQSHDGTPSWGTGIEQLMIGFVRQTISPWSGAWEQELNWKLFTEQERAQGYYVKFNLNGLLRGDMEARADFYAKIFGLGSLSINQICDLEDMPGIGPDGDERFVSVNLQPLGRVLNPPAPPPMGHNGGPPLDNTEPAKPGPTKEAA